MTVIEGENNLFGKRWEAKQHFNIAASNIFKNFKDEEISSSKIMSASAWRYGEFKRKKIATS